MGLSVVQNQAVKLYTPSEVKFNEKTSNCQWHLDYNGLVTCDDVSEILFNTETTGGDLALDGSMSYRLSGTNTAVSSFKLSDGSTDFIVGDVEVGMYVKNLTDNTFAKIIEIISDKELLLDTDIFLAFPVNYEIAYYQLTGNITQGTNELIKTSGAVGSFVQSDIFSYGSLYKITIDILEFGYTTAGDSIQIKVGGETVKVINGLIDEATGTVTLYVVARTNSSDFEISMDSGVTARVSSFAVYRVINAVLFVINCETDEIVYISTIDDYLISNAQIKISFDWGNLSEGYTCSNGCYRFGIMEDIGIPENLLLDRISNGGFDSSTDWTFGVGWSLSLDSGRASSAGGAGYLQQTSLAYDFSSGIAYDIEFDIHNYANGNVTVVLANSVTDYIAFDTYSGDGTYTFNTGILSKNYSRLVFVPNSSAISLFIDNVSAIADLSALVFDFESDCYSLSESHECTVKLSGTNLDNAFGVNFTTNFYAPFIRVQGELRMPMYEDDSEVEEDSLGVNRMIYFNSDKVYTLHLYDLPEYLHDFIRLLKGYDTFLIDDEQYFPTDKGYKPDWIVESNKVYDKANVNFNVKQKTELNKNKYC